MVRTPARVREGIRPDAAGDIPLGTVEAFEQAAVAREAEDLREHFEERAGIFEHDAGLPRPEAGIKAAQILPRIEVSFARCWKGNNWFDMEIAHEKSSHGRLRGRYGDNDKAALAIGVATLIGGVRLTGSVDSVDKNR